MRTKKPYRLKFVNNGEAFAIPNWTTERHEGALAKLTTDMKGATDEEQEAEFKHYVISETLSQIDETGDCTLEIIRSMHAIDKVEIFKAIYNAGREGIYSSDFRKELETRTRQKLKSIGKKSSKSSKN